MRTVRRDIGDMLVRKSGSGLSRRGFLRTSAVAGIGGLIALSGPGFGPGRFALAAEDHAGVSPDDALKMLMEGNARYVAAKLQHPNLTVDRRNEVAKGQYPYATVLGCADSRVAPEHLFDAGLGDLFTIRVAGNIADDGAIASIEYSVEHLGSTLVVVLGHERCGAVAATVDTVKSGATPPGHLSALIDPIRPAVAKANEKGGDTVDEAVSANATLVAAQLRASDPVLSEMVSHDKIKIVAARYDLDTGEVAFLA
jgi:carbonic anhydrase